MINPKEAPEGCYACIPDERGSPCGGCHYVSNKALISSFCANKNCVPHSRKDGQRVIFKSLELSEREQRIVQWAWACGAVYMIDHKEVGLGSYAQWKEGASGEVPEMLMRPQLKAGEEE